MTILELLRNVLYVLLIVLVAYPFLCGFGITVVREYFKELKKYHVEVAMITAMAEKEKKEEQKQ